MSESRCRTCKEPILWITLESKDKPDKPHPVNPAPSESGSIRCTLERGKRTGRVITPAERKGRLYVSHFATCPDADQWRCR